MDIRAGTVLAAVPLLICFACGPKVTAIRESDVPEPIARTAPPTPSATSYRVAPTGLAADAARFVRTVCAYRTTGESAHQFLVRAHKVASPAEVALLHTSQRAQLNWPALRARHERADATITGVTFVGQTRGTTSVVVEFVLTTRTDFAVVREFAEMSIDVVATSAGLRVSAAEGACL